MICGVDEAGKGSVLGPMVVAAVGARSEDVLSDLDIRDSKLLSFEKREHLFGIIGKRCSIATLIIPPGEIDEWRKTMSMNTCIARAHAVVIRRLQPVTAYVDACDVNPDRYGRMVLENLDGAVCRIVSEHHADRTYRIVSAASIIAKVVRDREVGRLSTIYGSIGSGYPSDPVTISFLSFYIRENRRAPPCARKSWKTICNLIADAEQDTLFVDPDMD